MGADFTKAKVPGRQAWGYNGYNKSYNRYNSTYVLLELTAIIKDFSLQNVKLPNKLALQ
jgi:hypothetical protein